MLAKASWQSLSWRRGTTGRLAACFAAVRVRVADGPPQRIRDVGAQHMPGEEVWLIGERRSNGERKYYLSNLPPDTPLKALADMIKAHWSCELARKRRLPLYVAEGTSLQKMRKINSVAYLRYCYDALRLNSAATFVYGHSADENDAHIYRAIFGSQAKHLYFGVYKLNEQKLKELDGLLSKYQKTAGSSLAYTFFDSESAKVWDA